jgi:hypothetical protein
VPKYWRVKDMRQFQLIVLGVAILHGLVGPVAAGNPPDPPIPAQSAQSPPEAGSWLFRTEPPAPSGNAVQDFQPATELRETLACACRGHFVVGAGFYFLKPYFGGNPAFSTRVTSTATTTDSSTTTTFSEERDFDFDPAFAPLIWFGYVTQSGLGVRARWWHLTQSADASALNNDVTGATVISSAGPGGLSFSSPGHLLGHFGAGADELFFKSRLKMDVWDFEATQDIQAGGWTLLVSGGVRYAHLAQNYNAFRFNSGVGDNMIFDQDSTTLLSGHSFSGAGPTVALELARPFGNTGFSLYTNARGALLFGCTHQHASRLTVQSGMESGGMPFNTTSFSDSDSCRSSVLPVAEIEVGAQYDRAFGLLHPFVRTGLVGQSWFGAGNASGSGGTLGLLGLTVTAGLNY